MTIPPSPGGVNRSLIDELKLAIDRVQSVRACGNDQPCHVCNGQLFAISRDLRRILSALTEAASPASFAARAQALLPGIESGWDIFEPCGEPDCQRGNGETGKYPHAGCHKMLIRQLLIDLAASPQAPAEAATKKESPCPACGSTFLCWNCWWQQTRAAKAAPPQEQEYVIADDLGLPVLFWLQQELRDVCPDIGLASGVAHGIHILRQSLRGSPEPAKQEQEPSWRPIATAPKGGHFLVTGTGWRFKRWPRLAYEFNGRIYGEFSGGVELFGATHWLSLDMLPEAPVTDSANVASEAAAPQKEPSQ